MIAIKDAGRIERVDFDKSIVYRHYGQKEKNIKNNLLTAMDNYYFNNLAVLWDKTAIRIYY